MVLPCVMASTTIPTILCPKCQTERSESETECLKCGIVFAKYRPVAPLQPMRRDRSRWMALAKEWLVDSDQSADAMTFAGRAILFVLLLWWGKTFILTPLVCLATFLVKTRDPFGASVTLWWVAESCMDLAPYINDARTLDLLLLGGVTGKETDGHDWNNILTMLGWLEYDHRLADRKSVV